MSARQVSDEDIAWVTGFIRQQCSARGIPRQDAEDYVQDGLLALVEAAATFNGQQPWAKRRRHIVEWRAIDGLNRRIGRPRTPRRRAETSVCSLDHPEAADLTADVRSVGALERAEVLELLRRRLDGRMWEILRLRYHDSLTQGQVSVRVGIPVSAVRRLERRAREKGGELISELGLSRADVLNGNGERGRKMRRRRK